jgi:pyruvate dehydrogenase E2 component (dihydrolipoamide acetyltransferase)
MATGAVVDVVMPQMGVSVSEGTVTRWLRNVGDTIEADQPLLEISTDKVDTEVPSPGSGVLQAILVHEGETVPVGTLVGRIGAGMPAESEPEPAPPPGPAATAPEPSAAQSEFEPDEDDDVGPEPARLPDRAGAGNGAGGRHSFVSPVVARIAAEHGIDPSTLSGTGRDGRVTKKDILGFVESGAGAPADPPEPKQTVSLPPPLPAEPAVPVAAAPEPRSAPPPERSPAPAPRPRPAAPVAAGPSELEPGETLEPMSAMRRGIADHMRRSLDTAAHVTSGIEVDLAKVVAIRERLKAEFTASYGVNPTYLSFIARAAVETLREWPLVGAEIRGESIVTRNHVNLGFAVALEGGGGLIVPVLKHAEGLNLLGMARGIADLAERARTKKLLPDDVQGGTFTITNPGSYGTFMGPQTAILGTYALVKRPWVITDDAGHDAIAIRPMMNLTLTYDHRLVDGAYGAQFLRDLAGRLESWSEADY